jgi:hypothetical protein
MVLSAFQEMSATINVGRVNRNNGSGEKSVKAKAKQAGHCDKQWSGQQEASSPAFQSVVFDPKEPTIMTRVPAIRIFLTCFPEIT